MSVTDWAERLTTLYQSERLAAAAIEQMVRNARSDDTKMVLMVSLAMHSTRVVHLREFLDLHGSVPNDKVELPSRLTTMLGKKNLPEKLMFSWLSEFEARVLEHYETVQSQQAPREEKLYFETMLNDQKGLVEKINTFSQRLTIVADPALWE